ncbi:MAG: hypothetical protein RR490_08270 [Niameybacter sp.]
MSKKKKIGIITALLILIVGAGGWFVYTGLTDYVIVNMFEAILMEDLETQGIQVTDEKITEPKEQITVPKEQNTVPKEQSQEVKNEVATPIHTAKGTVTKVDVESRVKEIVKNIPIRDKNAVMRLVAQNISSNDIRYLSGLAADGNVSGSDIAAAKAVAIRSFSSEQLEDVKYYYYKYIGLFSEFYN